jgi:hypothetical protein
VSPLALNAVAENFESGSDATTAAEAPAETKSLRDIFLLFVMAFSSSWLVPSSGRHGL